MDTIWRNDDREVLKAYIAEVQRQDEARARLRAQLAEWGFANGNVMVGDSAWGTHLYGIEVPEGVTLERRSSWPEGWRVDREKHCLMPARTTRAGKPIAKVFDKLANEFPNRHVLIAAVGMPGMVMEGLHVTSPALARDGDTLWCRWSLNPSRTEHVASTWQRVKLSEYYAMVEGGHDPFATKEGKR